MSVDSPANAVVQDAVTGSEQTTFPRPRAHGASVMNVFNDLDATGSATLYDRVLSYWREHVGDREREPWVVVDDLDVDWLPDGEYVALLTSSSWKAGTGRGDNYSAYYEYHLKIRRVGADGEFYKPAVACHIEIMPQYADLVYKSGDPLPCTYGEGTKLIGWTTWAETPQEIETRMYDVVRAAFGDDVLDPGDRVDDARRVPKAEAHIRFHQEKKNQVVSTIDQTEDLIAFGGESEIDSAKRRLKQGWLEAYLSSDRWDLLGFDATTFDVSLKVYQRKDWYKRSDEFAHPKLEAGFAGVQSGALPHVDDWDQVMDQLRTIVATHAIWAGVGRADLVADDFYDGSACEPYQFEKPTGRRDMLLERYHQAETRLYQEALKESTMAVYDILRIIVEESGASYDHLVTRTGLARSTIRYHARRLEDAGVLKRLGNPVLLVFESWDLYDRAEDVIQEVYPDDTHDDQDDRIQERRQHRQDRQDRAARAADQSDTTDDDTGRPSPAATDSAPGDQADGEVDQDDRADRDDHNVARKDLPEWAFVDDLPALSLADLYMEYHEDQLAERDVQVRTTVLDPRYLRQADTG